MLTRKKRQSSLELRECFFSSQWFGLTAVEVGTVTLVSQLAEVISECQAARSMLVDAMSEEGWKGMIWDVYNEVSVEVRRFPEILFRLGYDIVDPLRNKSLLTILFGALDTTGFNESLLAEHPDCCFWFVILRLCFLEDFELETSQDPLTEQVLRGAA